VSLDGGKKTGEGGGYKMVQSTVDVVVGGKLRPLLTPVVMPLILQREREDSMSTG
jgi:hypothetical protein